ncbi:hypothetical protein BH11PSE3_BH11PSE3_21720 [soil metagenome]
MRDKEATAASAYNYDEAIPPGFYDEIYRRKAGIRYSWHHLKFRAVAARLAPATRILDIGCGPGTFIGNYLGAAECLGIDLSASQIDYANRHYGNRQHRFSTQSPESLLDADERFDAIAMIELIEHLTPPEALRLLALVRRLLSPDGTLVLTTPNYGSLWPLIELGVNFFSRVRYERQHINRYRRGRLAATLEEAGFRSVTMETIVGFAPFAALLGSRPVAWVDTIERHTTRGAGNLLLAVARR